MRIKRLLNLQEARKRDRENYYRNRKKCLASAAKWKRENPDKLKVQRHKQETLKKNAKGAFTVKDIEYLREKQKGKCSYHKICKGNLSKKGNQIVEHKTPLSRGGTNWRKNLQLTCRSCNSSKRNKRRNKKI